MKMCEGFAQLIEKISTLSLADSSLLLNWKELHSRRACYPAILPRSV